MFPAQVLMPSAELPLIVQLLLAGGVGAILLKLVEGWNARRQAQDDLDHADVEQLRDEVRKQRQRIGELHEQLNSQRKDYAALEATVRTALRMMEKTHPETHAVLEAALGNLDRNTTNTP